MLNCWEYQPAIRPNFAELMNGFATDLQAIAGYMDFRASIVSTIEVHANPNIDETDFNSDYNIITTDLGTEEASTVGNNSCSNDETDLSSLAASEFQEKGNKERNSPEDNCTGPQDVDQHSIASDQDSQDSLDRDPDQFEELHEANTADIAEISIT